jgi:hypothetical protein
MNLVINKDHLLSHLAETVNFSQVPTELFELDGGLHILKDNAWPFICNIINSPHDALTSNGLGPYKLLAMVVVNYLKKFVPMPNYSIHSLKVINRRIVCRYGDCYGLKHVNIN